MAWSPTTGRSLVGTQKLDPAQLPITLSPGSNAPLSPGVMIRPAAWRPENQPTNYTSNSLPTPRPPHFPLPAFHSTAPRPPFPLSPAFLPLLPAAPIFPLLPPAPSPAAPFSPLPPPPRRPHLLLFFAPSTQSQHQQSSTPTTITTTPPASQAYHIHPAIGH